ncbi:uncharacterized protein LOC129808690 [Phlebotomus papatasi]|uniref:uncharacterized protein LOC129808690 n=1 Tax=Phlebotomus papatasi TaxID=29031 RepID=UPI002483D117|nr:uncharacterized protein LOC129808690 [Phlebotomus papatasi]
MPNTLEKSRGAYKGQLTTIKKILERYKMNPKALEEEGAERTLIAQREMVGRIENKFQAVQRGIIDEATTPEELTAEENELVNFIDECCQVELELSQLIASFNTPDKAAKEEGSVSGVDSSDQTIQQLITLMSKQLNEQRQQRMSEENKLKEILASQRAEIEKIVSSKVESDRTSPEVRNNKGSGLEPIKIPTFGGLYHDWPTFKNLFISTLENNKSLTGSQKMQYLRSNTTGEALGLFVNMPLTDENYKIAWSRLEKRYDDKLVIATAFMDKFLGVQETTKPDAVALRRIQSVTGQCLEALDALPVTGRDPWLIHWTLQRVDHQTRSLWSDKKPEGIPTWSDFDDFLNARCKSLESCSSQQKTTLSCSGAAKGVNSHVLFATAMVKVLGKDDGVETCRVILDPASQVNIISTNMCQRLRLSPKRTNFIVDGVGCSSNLSQKSVQIKLQYQVNSSVQVQAIDCLVMQKVVGEQPNWKINVATIPIPAHVVLADPSWYETQRVDLLIGGAHAWDFLGVERQSLGEGLPMLQQSVFGWLVVGPCYSVQQPEVVSCNVTTLSSIERAVKKFWEIEEVPREFISSSENQEVEAQFGATTTRSPDGRYVVQIPLRSNVNELGNNRRIAVNQLNYLRRKLEKNQPLYSEYGNIFKEYLTLGIIERVPLTQLENPSYYLPHHCVIRESSASTKIRIVFNASSKTKSGISLNDCIKSCPVVQPSLIAILWRFRMHQYAMTCDIVKMYLQVGLHPPHKDLHRFVWVENSEVVDFRFQRVCFGVAASPYLATRVLNQLAEDEKQTYPIGSMILQNHFYVDDCLYSAPTIEMVQEAESQLKGILQKAGMTLSKFRTNDGAIFSTENDSLSKLTSLELDKEAKALGITWNPSSDTFQFKETMSEKPEIITKRYLFSTVAKIFDPCGLIGPIITTAKAMLQETWTKALEWDKEIPGDLLQKWNAFTDDLAHLKELRINRWISHLPKVYQYELHAFCDASMLAYGTAVYLVCESEDGQRSSNLLTSKSRITPIKSKEDGTRVLTIPKAELMGAELSVQLMKTVSKDLNIQQCFFWTDAKVVLHQIYAPEGRRTEFVRHKVSLILKSSEAHQWRHVSTKENPADVLSRGCKVTHLMTHDIWWHGPEWLTMDKSQWPPEFDPTNNPPSCLNTIAHDEPEPASVFEKLLERCSSFVRMKRILAWVMMAAQVFKTGLSRRTRSSVLVDTSRLRVKDLQKSELLLLKWDQQANLMDAISLLQRNQFNNIPPNVRKLKPFLDSDGVMRVGGRIDQSAEPYNVKHPIILPRGRLAELVALSEHQRLLHPGPQLSLSSLRQNFWPLNGRNLVRKIVRNCIVCTRVKPQATQQIMGDLPAPRVTHVLPFLHTGVDFTGHISIKRAPRGKVFEKAYVAIFVCMSTKAVHLEVLTSLSTNAFLSAFKRFISRRGLPAHIYSDNGTNFVGSDKMLQKMLQDHQMQNELTDYSSNLKVQWHFNPPAAPHHGGLWEAAVRSFKHHFKRVIGAAILTYEELNTIVVQIEAVLNSRPLVAVTNHPDDPKALTPGDLLIGRAPAQLPDNSDPGEGLSNLQRWQLCTKIRNDFTKRWRQEYLHTLQERQNWDKEHSDLSPGDVVLLRTESANSEWPLGIVQQVCPGLDNKVTN